MRVIKSRIEYWSQCYDRRVLVIKNGIVVVGIDFMQGDEPYDFSESNGDKSILAVYNASRTYLSGNDELECVNQAIWIWFELMNDGLLNRHNC